MKTAVEWLEDKIINERRVILNDENYRLFKKAKKMEKQQLIDFADEYEEYISHYVLNNRYKPVKSAEQYYNETFKSE